MGSKKNTTPQLASSIKKLITQIKFLRNENTLAVKSEALAPVNAPNILRNPQSTVQQKKAGHSTKRGSKG